MTVAERIAWQKALSDKAREKMPKPQMSAEDAEKLARINARIEWQRQQSRKSTPFGAGFNDDEALAEATREYEKFIAKLLAQQSTFVPFGTPDGSNATLEKNPEDSLANGISVGDEQVVIKA